MVAWYADGLLAGYSPVVNSMDYIYHFATPGSVDVNAETRIHYALDPGYGQSVSDFSRRFNVSAPITFAQADITAMGGKAISMGMFVAPASAFPEGKVPTPQEIYALGASKLSITFGDQYWSSIGTTPIDHLYTMAMNLAVSANTKWWVMLTPVRLMDAFGGMGYENVIPMGAVNSTYWTHARAISVWVNQTPTKPVITTQSQEAAPGSVIDINYVPGDPDSTLPDDAQRYHRDLAAVQFQYAPVPSPENPTPTWKNLLFKVDQFVIESDSTTTWTEMGASTFCRAGTNQGLRQGMQSPHDTRKVSLIESLKMSVYCGYGPDDDGGSLDLGPDADKWPVGTAALPGGDWQIRVRTFDFGHPYAGTASVSPLGLIIPYNQWIDLDNYPAANTSPWSDPIQISVTSQVPPPVPLSPVQDIAVEEGGVTRLNWQYRNTHVPAYEQVFRTVQMRKVGAPTWATIFDGNSGDSFVDVPASLVHTAVPNTEYCTDPGFESGTTGGWTLVVNPNYNHVSGTMANAAVAGKAHSGTHYLQMGDNSPADTFWGSSIEQRFDVNPNHNLFTFLGWIGSVNRNGLLVLVCWEDASGNRLLSDDFSVIDPSTWSPYESAVYQSVTDSAGQPEWRQVAPPPIKRHPDGVRVLVQMQGMGPANQQSFIDWRLDDVSLVGSSNALDDIVLEATNEYEWRVQVVDFDGVKSDWSDPARFWIVEPVDSGPVRPAPTSLVEGASLGCGEHRAFIYRRGGKERVGELTNLSHVDWGRLRDDISTASVIVSGWTEDCGRLLASLKTWAYELVLYRSNGYSTERVWEGPITLLTYEVDRVTIDAKDVVAYPYRRIIKQAMSDSQNGDTVVKRATRVIQNVMAPDDPNVLAYLTPINKDDDAKQYRSTPAYSRTAFEEVDDMAANAGLDYTAIGRSILLWDTSHRIGTLPEFKDDDLGSPPIVSEYGMSAANVYSVSDGNGVHGEAYRGGVDPVSGNDDPVYGLIEMLSSTWASDSQEDTGTYTQAGLETTRQSFKDFAERSIADRYPPPVVVRVPDNTTLSPKALVSIQQLVPGVAIPLRSTGTLRPVVATQKLDSIKVVEEKGVETITITMSPFGSDDAAVDQEEGA